MVCANAPCPFRIHTAGADSRLIVLEKILYNPVLIVPLVLAALFIVTAVTIMLAARFEKQPLQTFVPMDTGELLELNPYASAMNEAAAAMGFQPHGTHKHIKGGTYRVFASVWLSPSNDIIALVCAGRLAHLKCNTTKLFSQVGEDKYFVTADEFGTAALSENVKKESLLNADFYELLDHHKDRLAASGTEPIPYSGDRVWDEFTEMDTRDTLRLIEKGYAEFADPAQTAWRYTLKGACILAWLGHFKQLRAAKAQRKRMKIKRPGHRAYVKSTARAQPLLAVDVGTAQHPCPWELEPLKHSGIGIASFILALAMGTLEFASVLAIAMGLPEEYEVLTVVVLLLGLVGNVVGCVLGIVGSCQRNRKRVFAVLGSALNGLLILFWSGIFIIGLAIT